MKKGFRLVSLFLVVSLMLCLSACKAESHKTQDGGEMEPFIFTDSCGREVELGKNIERVAPSGLIASMILIAAAPEKMVSVSKELSDSQRKYLPDCIDTLEATGQLYGGKATLNLEQLLALDPQVMIDFGDYKDSLAADLDAFTEQTGIPAIFIESDLDSLGEAFRTVGKLLGCEERCNACAELAERTLAMAEENRAKISPEDAVRVMFTTGPSGLGTNPEGSFHAQVIDLIGAKNAIVLNEISQAGGGNPINLEQLYNFDPDIIIMNPDAPYGEILSDPAWAELEAVKNGRVYVIPASPYNFVADPPSVNMILGVWWLGSICYPEIYDYDLTEAVQECYRVLWGYELSDEEASAFLGAA